MSSKKIIFVAVTVLVSLLAAVQLASASDPKPNVLRAFLVESSTTCTNQSDSIIPFTVHAENKAEWPTFSSTVFPLGSRDTVPKTFVISGAGLSDVPEGTPPSFTSYFVSFTKTPSAPVGGIGVTWTNSWAFTSNARPDRWNPFVLPGETDVVWYYGIACLGAQPGAYQDIVTLTGTFNGESVTLTTPPVTYTVTAG